MVEGVDNATAMSLGLLRYFKAHDFPIRYVSFGNENYGPWETPYGDVPVDGEIYGKAFSAWVDAMRTEFPDVYYGVVGLWTPNDGAGTAATTTAASVVRPGGVTGAAGDVGSFPAEWCARPNRTDAARAACERAAGAAHLRDQAGAGMGTDIYMGVDMGVGVGVVKNWMEDLLGKTDALQKADWLVLHDYFYKDVDAHPLDAAALYARGLKQLHAMRDGVADFIARSAPPSTPVPPLALTEFQITAAYSGAGNATEQLASALFLATVIGEVQQGATGLSALNEFAWHAKWFLKSTPVCGTRSGGYGMVSFGHPDTSVPDGTVSPKYFGMALSRRVSGVRVLNTSVAIRTSTAASASTAPTAAANTAAANTAAAAAAASPTTTIGAGGDAGIKAYATEFSTGEVGLVLVNPSATAAAAVDIRLDEASVRAGALRGAKGAMLNGWVLSATDDFVTSPLEAPTVAVNGQTNGLSWGGPWPLDDVKPYTRGAEAEEALTIDSGISVDVPAASVAAIVLYPAGVAPSPPPSPPASPPPSKLWRCTGQGVHHSCKLYPGTSGFDTQQECEESTSCTQEDGRGAESVEQEA